MVKCITLEYPDGSVGTRGGIGPRFLARFDGDRDAALEHILAELVPVQNPDAVARIEDVTFPVNRYFREAWTRIPGAVSVDMPRARDIVTEHVRKARDVRLATEDIAYMRADEAGDTAEKQRIAAKKRALLDLPADIQSDLDAITTPEALEAWEPTWP